MAALSDFSSLLRFLESKLRKSLNYDISNETKQRKHLNKIYGICNISTVYFLFKTKQKVSEKQENKCHYSAVLA